MVVTTKDRFMKSFPAGADKPELVEGFCQRSILFFIERSNNTNTVIYEANVENGKLSEKDPVKVEWFMYAKGQVPVATEGLNMIERKTAYGSTTEKNEAKPGHYTLCLSALPAKKIDVFLDEEGSVHARAQIKGEEMELISIYVANTTSWGMPKVDYIDVKGRKEDGTFETERITK